jgi:hypothetical protein
VTTTDSIGDQDLHLSSYLLNSVGEEQIGMHVRYRLQNVEPNILDLFLFLPLEILQLDCLEYPR